MISDLIALCRIYRDKLLLILLILGMPWSLAAFWVPWWVNVLCLLTVPIAAGILIFHVLPPPPEPRRASDEPSGVPEAQIRKMRKMSSGVHTLLSRWSNVSSLSRTHIEEVTSQVDDVIAYSESAVVEIGKRFVTITRKTRQQVEFAVALVEQQKGGNDRRESRALPDLVAAYEELAAKVAASLAKVADSTGQLERRHEAVRQDFQHVDTLLDQLSAHDTQIGVLALNSSVAVGTSDMVSLALDG